MNSSANQMPPPTADPLEGTGNWFPPNLARITARLPPHPGHGSTAVATRPVAVFDFDNTCVFRDVGQAVFRYQLLHLRYGLEPSALAAILPCLEGDLAGRPLTLVTATLVAAYGRLWPLISDHRQAEARRRPEYRLFTTLLLWFVDQARRDQRLGPCFVLPFMAKLLAGQSLAQLRQLAAEVVLAAQAEPLIEETLECDGPEPLGRLAASYPLGLHAFPEMQALMQRLQRQGIDCYVVSASTEWLVKEAVRLLDFPVAADHIFGIRVRVDGGGVLTTADAEDYPITFRAGKAEIISRFITGSPVLVAGDADTDFEMLTLPAVAVRLLLNRNQSGLISTLYQDPDILLQGLDLRTGRFRPWRESIA